MPFQPQILCGRQSYKRNDEKGCRQSRVKREGSDDLPCSGGSRPVLMRAQGGAQCNGGWTKWTHEADADSTINSLL